MRSCRSPKGTRSGAAALFAAAFISALFGAGLTRAGNVIDQPSNLDNAQGLALPSMAAGVRRAPYLTDVSASTAMVNLATDTAASAPVVAWDLASTGCSAPSHSVTAALVTSFSGTLSGTTDYQFAASLAGLTANTAYCYRVTQNGQDLLSAPITFTTALAPGDLAAYSFAVVGDWGAGTTDEANVFTQIAAGAPAFLMTVGDNVYNSGSQAEYGDLNGGNAFAPAYLPKLGGGTPIFPAHGNHGFTGYSPYLANFPQKAVTAASGGTYVAQSYCCTAGTSGTHTYASAWYAFTWGNARFYVLEAAWADGNGAYQGDFTDHWNGPVAGCTPCGQELTWLQNDLAANASTPVKFAFFHYPLHADSGGQSSDGYLDGSAALEGVLASNGVDIAFNGHAHVYERNLPQIAGRPLVGYVTGGGGDAVGSVSGCSAFDAYAIGSSSACHASKPTSNTQVYHYLRVSVNGNRVTVTPTDELGRTFDSQTYTFGSGPAPTPSPSLSPSPSPSPSRSPSPSPSPSSSTSPSPSTSPTPTVGDGSLTFTPTADAYVSGGATSTNYGGSTVLAVGSSPSLHSYLMFNVQGLAGPPKNATLRLWTDTAGSGSSVHGSSTSWTEYGITYTSAPSYGSTVATASTFAAGTWLSYNVTSLVTGNGAFAFAYTSASSTPISFASREDSAHAPQLVISQ